MKWILQAIVGAIPGKVIEMYLIGSLPRGDYQLGLSDVDVYIITRGDGYFLSDILRKKIQDEFDREFDFKYGRLDISEIKDTDSNANKYKFLTRTDGVMIYERDCDLRQSLGLEMSVQEILKIFSMYDISNKVDGLILEANKEISFRLARKIVKELLREIAVIHLVVEVELLRSPAQMLRVAHKYIAIEDFSNVIKMWLNEPESFALRPANFGMRDILSHRS